MLGSLLKKTKYKKGSSYGVVGGDYYGEIFVLVKEDVDCLFFISIPNMKVRKVSLEKFEIGIKNKVLDYIQIVPKETYQLLKSHFENMVKQGKID